MAEESSVIVCTSGSKGLDILGRHIELNEPGRGVIKVIITGAPLDMKNDVIKTWLESYATITEFRNEHMTIKGRRSNLRSGTRHAFVFNIKETIPQAAKLPYNEGEARGGGGGGGGTPYVMGDTYVSRFWPPIFWRTKTTNFTKIDLFGPKFNFFLDLFGSNFQRPAAHPHQFSGRGFQGRWTLMSGTMVRCISNASFAMRLYQKDMNVKRLPQEDAIIVVMRITYGLTPRKKKNCYKCGGTNHIARYCPHKVTFSILKGMFPTTMLRRKWNTIQLQVK